MSLLDSGTDRAIGFMLVNNPSALPSVTILFYSEMHRGASYSWVKWFLSGDLDRGNSQFRPSIMFSY
jgi:hypothetical protein